MMTSLTNLTRFGFVLLTLLVWVHPGGVSAGERYVITEPTDFLFEVTESGVFLAQTYQTPEVNSDPQLWLYSQDTGALITENDDYIGLQSKIDLTLEPGQYRLRAATCCGDPNGWRTGGGWNERYELDFNVTVTFPTTTTWLPTTTSTEPTTTTSTTVPETTVPATTEVTTSLPPEASTTTILMPPPTVEPTTTLGTPSLTTSIAPSTTFSPTSTAAPSTTTSSLSPETSTSTTSIAVLPPETDAPAPDSTEPVDEPDAPLEPEAAVALATDPEALAEVTAEEAAEIFDAIEPENLTAEEAAAIIEAVQDAPDEVRGAFEQEINIYSGTFDQYVPLGSVIDVGQRRSLIAAMTTVTVVAVPSSRKR